MKSKNSNHLESNCFRGQ